MIKITHPPGRVYPIINFEIDRIMPIDEYFKIGSVVVKVLAYDIYNGRIYGSGEIQELINVQD